MQLNTKFNMRDQLKDEITGCTGIVTGIHFYDTGCTHYSLQQKVNKEGKVPDWESFDETRLVLVKKAKVPKVAKPVTSAPRRESPPRQ